jgi:hypothetical protein
MLLRSCGGFNESELEKKRDGAGFGDAEVRALVVEGGGLGWMKRME